MDSHPSNPPPGTIAIPSSCQPRGMDLPRYEYEPLSGPNDIRVLELSATKTRIEARILHVSVSARSFQALSYVWGNPNQESTAVILDATGTAVGWIPLTKNLGHAMRDLRDAEELESKVFWIDQVCINQQDAKEKNHQVAMMSQVYHQASRVITYLGPTASEEEERRGIQLLKRISGTISDTTWHQIHEAGSIERVLNWKLDGSMQLEQLPSDLDLKVNEPHDEEKVTKRYIEQGWKWLVHAAYGEWTQRLWIVQEQLLNNDITTLRGRRLIDWDSIATVPILFAVGHLPRQYRDAGLEDLGESLVPWDRVEFTLYGVWWERYSRLEPGTSYSWASLLDNLLWYLPLRCSDPRDRVYAILAISQDANDPDLNPDYSTTNTAVKLSKKLSIWVLKSADDLLLLSSAFHWPQSGRELPSWCLTLDSPEDFNTPDVIYGGTFKPHPKHDHYLARFHTNDAILVVKGRILDYVSTASPSTAWPQDIDFLSGLIHLLPDGFSIEDVISLLRTVTARSPWSPPPSAEVSAKEVMAFHFWAYIRSWSRWIAECDEDEDPPPKEMRERCDDIATKVQALASCFTYPERNDYGMTGEENTASERVERYVLGYGRCLGRTDAGRFYNAVHTVEKGDAVVALQGADRLYVVRYQLVDNTYKLVGEVYVDGLMHGEAYENQDADKIDKYIELS